MKNHLSFLFSFFMLFLGVQFSAQAANEPFGILTCNGALNDAFKISVRNDEVRFVWKARKRVKAHPFVENVASPKVPKHLLVGYTTVETEIAFPIDDCDFFAPEIGEFTCKGKGPVGFVARATLDKSVDTYKGKLSSFVFKSERTTSLGATHLYGVSLKGKSNGKLLSAATGKFIAQPHSADGFSHDSECTVDGAPLNLSKE